MSIALSLSSARSLSSSAVPASPKQDTLRRFTEAIRQSQGLEQLLEEALRCIEETFEACCAALLEEEGERLTLRAIRGGGSRAEASQAYASLCILVANRVRDERKPLLLEDASHLPRHGGKQVRSLLAVPLPVSASTSAVLCVGAFVPRAFGPEEMMLLELMADRVGLALADERGRSAEQRSRAQLEAVRAAALLFAEPIDLHSALQRIVDQARRISDAAYAALGLAQGDSLAPFNPWVFSGISEEVARHIGRMPRPVGLLGEVLSTGEVVRLEDAAADPRFGGVPAHHPHLTSFLGVPITLQGRRLGNLYLANKVGGGGFTEEDEQTVRLLAQHAALAVESAQVRERTQGDMEALRTTHAALEESEERLRRTLEDAPIGMAVVDLDGYFRRVNRVLCELVGRTPEELRELRDHDITDPEDLELELREMERLLRGQQDRFQIAKRYLRKDGSKVEVRLSRSLLRDERGQPLQFIAQMQDITEQNRVERALLEGERRFRSLFDNALEGILILDQEGRFLDANPATCALLRQPRSALLGRSFLELADGMRVEQRQEQWQRFLLQGEQKGEFAARLPDGQVLEVEFSARAHFMPGQHLVVLRDITQRKRSNAALRRSEALLRLTMENLQVGVWIADEHGTII
ncbi:MAG TPA: PAS domain S-box protein, partial [Myxococcaceae bacterium]|nr:PAS domain S-box protein [Myxococcaceae bacterium]